MWDQLIVCYQLLGKKAAALDAIHARLEVGRGGGSVGV
jgi:hypothetical protein